MLKKRLISILLAFGLIFSSFSIGLNFQKKQAAAYVQYLPLAEALAKYILGATVTYCGFKVADEVDLFENIKENLNSFLGTSKGAYYMMEYNNDFAVASLNATLDEIMEAQVSEVHITEDINDLVNYTIRSVSENLNLYQKVSQGSSVVKNCSNFFNTITNGYITLPGYGITIVNNNPDSLSKVKYNPNDAHAAVLHTFIRSANNYVMENYLGSNYLSSAYSCLGEFYYSEPIYSYKLDDAGNYIYDFDGNKIKYENGYKTIMGNIYSNYRSLPCIYTYKYSSSNIIQMIANSNYSDYSKPYKNNPYFSYFNSETLYSNGNSFFNDIFKEHFTDLNFSSFLTSMENISVYTVTNTYYDDTKDTYSVMISDNILSKEQINNGGQIILYDYIDNVSGYNFEFCEDNKESYNIKYNKSLQQFEYIKSDGTTLTTDVSGYVAQSNQYDINTYSSDVNIASNSFANSQDYAIDKISDSLTGKTISIDNLEAALDKVKNLNIDILDEKTIVNSVIDALSDSYIATLTDTDIIIDNTVTDTNNPVIDDTITDTNNPAIDNTITDTKSLTLDLPFIDTIDLPKYKMPASSLADVFPFCLPFDLIDLVNVLKAEPTAPKITIPNFKMSYNFKINRIDDLVVDLSCFDFIARIFRYLILILIILGLIKNADKFIGGGKT